MAHRPRNLDTKDWFGNPPVMAKTTPPEQSGNTPAQTVTPSDLAKALDARIQAFLEEKKNPVAGHALAPYKEQLIELRRTHGATYKEIATVLGDAGILTDEKSVTYFFTLLGKSRRPKKNSRRPATEPNA